MAASVPPGGGPRAVWRAGLVAALAASAAGLAAMALVLAGLRSDRAPGAEAGRANLHELRWFWIAGGAAWAALTALWLVLRRRPAAPQGARTLRAWAVILAVAAAARGAVLATHEPALSDDVYRYVHDGRHTASGANPYLCRPADAKGTGGPPAPPHDPQLLARLNYPELHTIYLPSSQWAFALAALLAGRDASAAHGALVMRVLLVLIELGAIAIVLEGLHRAGRPAWWAVLYALHPMALSEIAGSGHQESLGIALLTGALLLGGGAAARPWLWSGLLGLAAMVKPVTLPPAAFLLRDRPLRDWLATLGVGAAVCAAVAAPFWVGHGGEALANLRATGSCFALKWAHFGGVYEPLLGGVERLTPGWIDERQQMLARRLCAAALAGVFLWLWARRRGDAWSRSGALLLVMVLLSPAAHPWYLLWALALVPMAPGPAVWVASLTLPWGYAALGDTAGWSVPAWLPLAAWAPIWAALAAAWAWERINHGGHGDHGEHGDAEGMRRSSS